MLRSWPVRTEAMQDAVSVHLRIHLLRTRVNRDAGGYGLDFDCAEPLARAEFTSRTPEMRRSPSIRESNSSSLLPLPNINSASSS